MLKNCPRSSVPLVLAACLSACTHSPGLVASADDEKDGQNFAARPGMARLYIVQGLARYGDYPSDQVRVDGLLIAGVIYTARGTPPVMPPDPMDRDNKLHHAPIAFPNDIFVNGKQVGTVGHLQYVALDLPPAQYEIKVTASTVWHQFFGERKITLKYGDVAFLMNTELAYESMQKNERSIVECQPEDCKAYVLAAHRVKSDWK